MSRIAILAAGLASIVSLAALPGSASAASFNCYAHLTYTEKAICDNPGLSNADSQLTSIYYSLLNSAGPGARRAIQMRQYHWLGERNRCGANVGCLWNKYNRRIQLLSQAGY